MKTLFFSLAFLLSLSALHAQRASEVLYVEIVDNGSSSTNAVYVIAPGVETPLKMIPMESTGRREGAIENMRIVAALFQELYDEGWQVVATANDRWLFERPKK